MSSGCYFSESEAAYISAACAQWDGADLLKPLDYMATAASTVAVATA